MNTHHSLLIQTTLPKGAALRWILRCVTLCFLASPLAHCIELNEFPSPVQETINTLSQGHSVAVAGASVVLGESLFEAKISRDGVERRWTLDASGVPLTVSILPREAPEAVQKAIQTQAAKAGTLTEILRSYEEGKVVYDAVFRSALGQLSYTIDAAGLITSREIPLTQAPPKVLKRASALLKGAIPAHCYYSEEDHEPYFTFSTAQPSGPRWVTLDAKGDLSEEEELISKEQLPEPVKNAILQRLGNTEHVRILQKKDDESTHFEVWSFNGGKLTIFWVSSDASLSDVPPNR